MRRNDTAPFEAINVDKAQKIAGRSAQDTNFNSYNARLAYPRGSNEIYGDFHLFKIPEGDNRWKCDLDEKGIYRSDAVSLVRPYAPLDLLTAMESAARQKLEKAGVAAFANYQSAYQVDYLLSQEASARQKRIVEAQLELMRAEKRARAQIIQAHAERLKPIVIDMNFSLNAAEAVTNKRLQAARDKLATIQLGLYIRYQQDCLSEFEALRVFYQSEEQMLQQREVAGLQALSDGEMTNENAVIFLHAIAIQYDALSRIFLPLLNTLFSQLSLVDLSPLQKGIRAGCFMLVANVHLLCTALTQVIAQEDTHLNVTLIYEAVRRLNADVSLGVVLNHWVFKDIDMSALTRLFDHPLFDVHPFPFSNQLKEFFKKLFPAIRSIYYNYVLGDFVFHNRELSAQFSEKKSVIRDLYYSFVHSVIHGAPISDSHLVELMSTFDLTIGRIPTHVAARMPHVSKKFVELIQKANELFRANIHAAVSEPLYDRPVVESTVLSRLGRGLGHS